MFARMSAAIARRPVLAASTFLGGKYFLADAIVQHKTCTGDRGYDTGRLSLFGVFGFYYGAVNYYVYKNIQKIPWGGTRMAVIGMSAFDIFIHLPGLFFPQFYVVRACIFRNPWPTTGAELAECAKSGLQTYRANFFSDLQTLIMVFTPIDLCMFCLPLHLRTPFLGTFGMIFPMVLSWLRGERSEEE